jgi:hypothetical protein
MNLRDIGIKFNIPVVSALPGSVENIETFRNEVADLVGMEGYVIRFDDGQMIKMKADAYIHLHHALDAMRFEKDILHMILDEKIDDVKGVIAEDLRDALDNFAADIFKNVHQLAEDVYWETITSWDNMNQSKKRFAIENVNVNQKFAKCKSLLFTCWDKISFNEFHTPKDGVDGMVKIILNDLKVSCGTQSRVDGNRHLMGGIRWTDYATVKETEE